MVSSVGSAAGCSTAALCSAQSRGPRDPAALQEKLFNKLDVNGDGGIDQSELGDFLDYVSSATGSTTQTDSSQLFKTLDADGDGAISKQELTDGAKKLFEELRAQLASTKSEKTEKAEKSGESQAAGKPDPKALFAKIDANGDGSISQDELGTFMSQKPGHGHGGHGGGFPGRIESLLDQYRSTATADAADDADAAEAVSAVA
jgi:Ca2+-binding EF-hand superfamily protein